MNENIATVAGANVLGRETDDAVTDDIERLTEGTLSRLDDRP